MRPPPRLVVRTMAVTFVTVALILRTKEPQLLELLGGEV